jgi:antimicrobial peptide system SdpA family protein
MFSTLWLPFAWSNLLLVAAIYSVHAVVPPNVLRLPGENKQVAVALWPQGWGFFTRSGQEADPYVFRRTGGQWRPATYPPPSALGLRSFNRRTRAQGVEVGLIFNQLSQRKIKPLACNESIPVCLDALSVQAELQNVAFRPTACEDLGIVMQPPLPWAYRASRPASSSPAAVWRIHVQC